MAHLVLQLQREGPLGARLQGRCVPPQGGDDLAIGDSTRIIEELERRHPDPPLYPHDAAERSRALELEDFFDEELGHDVRRLAMDAVRRNLDLAAAAIAPRAGSTSGERWRWRSARSASRCAATTTSVPLHSSARLIEYDVLEWIEDIYARHRGARRRG